jgi:hypothetical protein
MVVHLAAAVFALLPASIQARSASNVTERHEIPTFVRDRIELIESVIGTEASAHLRCDDSQLHPITNFSGSLDRTENHTHRVDLTIVCQRHSHRAPY